jgi:predicted Zn-dependent protease
MGLAISLFHTVPWVAVNASPDRAFERFFTLPLGLGRVESTVGYWFAIQERFDLAEKWLIQSVQENPANVRAHALLGDIYLYREQYERASLAYAEASRIRPDKRIFRLRFVDSSVRAGRLESAAFELRVMLEHEPGNADLWAALAVVLAGMGETGDSRAAIERAAGLDSTGYGGGLALLQSDDAYSRLMGEYWLRIFGS